MMAKNKGPVIKPLPGQKKKVAAAPQTAEEQAKRDEQRAARGTAKGLKHSSSIRSGGFGWACTHVYVRILQI